jgi:hypothetical protein
MAESVFNDRIYLKPGDTDTVVVEWSVRDDAAPDVILANGTAIGKSEFPILETDTDEANKTTAMLNQIFDDAQPVRNAALVHKYWIDNFLIGDAQSLP